METLRAPRVGRLCFPRRCPPRQASGHCSVGSGLGSLLRGVGPWTLPSLGTSVSWAPEPQCPPARQREHWAALTRSGIRAAGESGPLPFLLPSPEDGLPGVAQQGLGSSQAAAAPRTHQGTPPAAGGPHSIRPAPCGLGTSSGHMRPHRRSGRPLISVLEPLTRASVHLPSIRASPRGLAR